MTKAMVYMNFTANALLFWKGNLVPGNPAVILNTSRKPSFSFVFPNYGFTHALFAADSDPRSALGAPLDLIGFAVKRDSSKVLGLQRFLMIFGKQ